MITKSVRSIVIAKSSKVSLWIFFGLLAYVPLHILLSTWLGTYFGLLDFAKVAKDVALILGFISVVVASHRHIMGLLKQDRLIQIILAYALVTLFMALIKPTDQDAEILAIVYNLRFLVFFVYAALLAKLYKSGWLCKKALLVVMSSAFLVMAFGIVQYLWLPDDALAKIGYSRENGVLPAFHIDDKPDLERIMSTLRDPNSLGSYIIIILSIALTYLLRTKNQNIKRILIGFIGLSLICLWFTFSRGAWIGALVAVVMVFWLLYKRRVGIKINNKLIAAVGVFLVLGGVGLWLSKDTYFARNVIFHADDSTVLEDPNQLRLRFWQESVDAAIENPLGYGPGTAGLPSIRNNKQGTILNENYYLQILHEVGVVGLGLFIAILVAVGSRLYRLSGSEPLAAALLASFIGLAITNLLVHAWANEAVAYTWWGLAGLAVLTVSKTTNRKQ